MDRRCRIYILSHSGLLAGGIQSLLEREKGTEIVGCERDGRTALKAMSVLKPDVLILEDSVWNNERCAIDQVVREAGIPAIMVVSLKHNHATVYRFERCRIDSPTPTDLIRTILGSRPGTDNPTDGPHAWKRPATIDDRPISARFTPDSQRRSDQRQHTQRGERGRATRSKGRLT
jgi:hypothetical protein